jgi:hypothetical protein
MTVMLGNDGGGFIHYAAGAFPGRVGWLQGPAQWKQPWPWLPYALDNDAFTLGPRWTPAPWLEMLAKARAHPCQPRWVLVPDVVGDRQGTLDRWQTHAATAAGYGWPLAFAVQDGMTPADVPAEASVIFVGGSTAWKWQTAATWCAAFPRVHVGRVNTVARLDRCAELGAESVDGTGWVRNPSRPDQLPALHAWLRGESPGRDQLTFTALAS